MSGRYLLFDIKCRGDDVQQFLVDKEQYPNLRWQWVEAHPGEFGHPAKLVINAEPGSFRVEFLVDSLSWLRLYIGDTLTYDSYLESWVVRP